MGRQVDCVRTHIPKEAEFPLSNGGRSSSVPGCTGDAETSTATTDDTRWAYRLPDSYNIRLGLGGIPAWLVRRSSMRSEYHGRKFIYIDPILMQLLSLGYCIQNSIPRPKNTTCIHNNGYRHEVEVSGSSYFSRMKWYPTKWDSCKTAAHMALYIILVFGMIYLVAPQAHLH